MRQELREGNRSILSTRLQELMEERLLNGQQTMLFLNRRGKSAFMSCRACGFVVKCPHCDVSLSEHSGGVMVCHYCGYRQPVPKVCPSCGSKYISGFKAGTQKIEAMVARRFPQRVYCAWIMTPRGRRMRMRRFCRHFPIMRPIYLSVRR